MSTVVTATDETMRHRLAAAALSIGLFVVVPLALPCGLIAVLGGSIVRTLYPVYVLLAASAVLVKRRSAYPAFMIAVIAFAPFLRRLADFEAGFSVFSLILLAPYVGLLLTLPALLRRILRGLGPLDWPFTVITACVLYASVLAGLNLALLPACYEALRWLLPTALCAFILEEPYRSTETRTSLVVALSFILPIITVYGIYQFIAAPPWDVSWMQNIDNPTFGAPEAFRIRVFSMMNSPGTAGVFCSYAMLLLAGEGLGFLMVAISGLPLIALTLIRTAWLSLIGGLAVLLIFGTPRRRSRLLGGMGAVAVVGIALLGSPIVPSEVNTLISDRLATFSNLQTDTSTFDRLNVYDAFFERLSNTPWGEGFGANSSTLTTQTSKRNATAIDSGLLETLLIFGVFGGALYFIALASMLSLAFRCVRRRAAGGEAEFAVFCAVVIILPLGSNHIGEQGALAWAALGILLARFQTHAQTRVARQEKR